MEGGETSSKICTGAYSGGGGWNILYYVITRIYSPYPIFESPQKTGIQFS